MAIIGNIPYFQTNPFPIALRLLFHPELVPRNTWNKRSQNSLGCQARLPVYASFRESVFHVYWVQMVPGLCHKPKCSVVLLSGFQTKVKTWAEDWYSFKASCDPDAPLSLLVLDRLLWGMMHFHCSKCPLASLRFPAHGPPRKSMEIV